MLPNLLIIGAMKSATSSLHFYLSSYAEVFMLQPKELDFLIEERNLGRGIQWYESLERLERAKVLLGELLTEPTVCEGKEGSSRRSSGY